MATAAEKKALAEAKALKAKLEKQLKALEAQRDADTRSAANDALIAARERQAAADAKVAADKADAGYKAELAKQEAAIAKNKGFNTIGGLFVFNDKPFTGVANGKTYTDGVVTAGASGVSGLRPVGSKIFQMLNGVLYFDGAPYSGTAPQDGNRYINGVSYGKAIPEAVEAPALAADTFKNTLAIFFGQGEVEKPWANELYKSVSGFVKSGSDVDEAFNLALQASRNNPDMKGFTDRFKAIYAIQDLKASGKAIEVPTIAEYFKTESQMGTLLRNTQLGDLATGSFLSDVLSKGVDYTEFADRITAVFDRIDQAPSEIKTVLSEKFPTVDRTSLAKALLLGDAGAKQLEQKIQGYEVLAAANTQGIREQRMVGGQLQGVAGGITEAQAANYAAGGQTFATANTGFAQVAMARETEQKLSEMSGQAALGVSGLSEAILGKKAKELTAIENLSKQEENRFRGRAGVGTLASSKRSQSF